VTARTLYKKIKQKEIKENGKEEKI